MSFRARAGFTFCALVFSFTFLHSKTYTFEQALQRTYQIDDGVISAAKDVEKAKAEKRASFGLHFPTLGVSGKYTYINDPIDIDLNSIRSTIQPLYDYNGIPVTLPDFGVRVQDDEFFKAAAVATLPIYTGGKISAANMASAAGIDESEAKLENIKNNLLSDLSSKYFGAMLAKEVSDVRKSFMESTQEHAQNSAKMFNAGMIAKVEKMSADISYTQAHRDYISSLNDAELTNNVLKNALYETEDIDFASELFVCEKEDIEDLQYFMVAARAQNAGLKIYDAKDKLASSNLKLKTSEFIPSIYLFGRRELYEDDLTLLEPDYAYGVGFEWDIFSGFSSVNKRKAAKYQKESLSHLRRKQEKDIDTGVEYYHKKMLNAIYKYDSVQEEVEFAQEFLRARTLAFKAGTGTSLEVNMARTQLLKAELDSLSASYEFVTSLAGILNVSGMVENFNFYKDKAAARSRK
ncbi:outer membrane protein TolC [Elusimicrobium posterum]|uniref:TolC family protein n=1 Tax=Elusimicrobium posterum TaxID=3116653 RepID=UPI003C76AA60